MLTALISVGKPSHVGTVRMSDFCDSQTCCLHLGGLMPLSGISNPREPDSFEEGNFMFSIPKDHNSKEWKQFVAWIVGTLVMPFPAYIVIKETTPNITLDLPTIMILSFFWGITSLVLRNFIRKNIR